METKQLLRSYIKLVKNKKARTSSSKHYFQVYAEDGSAYLFTTTDLEKAKARAIKNPEDVYPVEFTEPEPKVLTTIKYVEVGINKQGLIKRLFNKITGK